MRPLLQEGRHSFREERVLIRQKDGRYQCDADTKGHRHFTERKARPWGSPVGVRRRRKAEMGTQLQSGSGEGLSVEEEEWQH